MNRFLQLVLSSALAFTAVVAATPAAFAQQAPAATSAPALTRAQIDAALAKPSEFLVIDVRRPDEVGAIGGFPVYLSIQIGDLERSLAFIPRDRTIITVSNHAARAQKAAALLAARGFKVLGAAGAQTYAEEGGTLVGQKASASAAPSTPSH
jgi:rhodanese-related sulfurtransferase